MLLFGHLGVTLGIFFLICLFKPRLRNIIVTKYLLVGALLPDIIDKPLGMIIFASIISSGRMIGHTLILSSILYCIGLSFYEKRGDVKILSLAAGSFFHLIEDQMWWEPQILSWPLFGWSFPKETIDNAMIGIEQILTMFKNSFNLNISSASIPEIFGMGVIFILILHSLLGKNKQMMELNEKSDTLLADLYVLGFILCGYVILISYYTISGDIA